MIIDIHGHIVPPELLKRYPIPASLADVDGMIEAKARLGIGLTIIGSPVGGTSMVRLPWPGSFLQHLGSRGRLAAMHDWMIETVAKHPGRLKALAYANPFDSEQQLGELQSRVRTGGFVGFIINSSVRGQYFDSPRVEPFFAMAAEMDLPVFLHPPAAPAAGERLRDPGLLEQVGRFCDVTASLAILIFSGILAKHPNLRIIAPFSGGAISLLQGRLDTLRQYGVFSKEASRGAADGGARALPENPSAYFRCIHVDTVSYGMPTLLANLQVLGADHILFGTDFPPAPVPLTESIDMIKQLPISDDDKQKIFSGNARRLFKLDDAAIAPLA
jgi:predicted TIM-barrel fold metal-dependent hydrolase